MWRKRSRVKPETEREIKDVEKARERTMNRAVKLLAAKPRSIRELRERLLEKSWTNAQIVDAVLEKLKSYKYLDDDQFARDVAISNLRQKPQGRRRLQQTMSRKQLDRETVDAAIDAAFEKVPEADLIDVAIEKYLRLKGRPEGRDEMKKFYDHLLRRGFDYSLIREKMSHISKYFDEE